MAPYKLCSYDDHSAKIDFSDAVNEFQIKSLVPDGHLYAKHNAGFIFKICNCVVHSFLFN